MIISKPKSSTLFSLGMFLLFTYAALYYSIAALLSSVDKPWYLYLLATALGVVALAVTVKVLLGYKVIRIGQGMFSASYPLSFRKKVFPVQALQSWEEIVIKTKSGVYKELRLNFTGKSKVAISNHENSNYEEVLKYMLKKHSRQRITQVNQ